MKLLISISVFILMIFTTKSQEEVKARKQELVAVKEDSNYKFVIDTIQFKDNLKKNLLPDTDVVLDKIQIVEQLTLGTKRKYSFILITCKNSNIKIAKWLNKSGKKYYINDVIRLTDGDLFEQSYVICNGVDDCYPNVYEDKEKIIWGCGETMKCFINEEVSTCKLSVTVLNVDEELMGED